MLGRYLYLISLKNVIAILKTHWKDSKEETNAAEQIEKDQFRSDGRRRQKTIESLRKAPDEELEGIQNSYGWDRGMLYFRLYLTNNKLALIICVISRFLVILTFQI